MAVVVWLLLLVVDYAEVADADAVVVVNVNVADDVDWW